MIKAKKEIEEMEPYQAPMIVDAEVKLNQNESPYNIPPELVVKIMDRIKAVMFNRYNEGSSKKLRELIATKFSVSPEQVIFGVGVDELLYYLVLAFLDRGEKVVRPVPSFAMYEICARVVGANDCPVMLTDEFELSEDFVREAKDAKLVFICSPNNPTSNSFDKKTIERVIIGTKGIVCIDEAYAEFAKDDCLEFLKYPNVIIMRTFSKAYSCAGVRLGYAISTPGIINRMDRVKLPWNVSVLSQVVGEIVLENDKSFMANVAEVKQNRDRMVAEMKKMVPALSCDANFITFKIDDPNKAFGFLLSRGVLVRNISKYPMLSKFLRVNVGTTEENKKFLDALRSYLGKRLGDRSVATKGIIFDIDGVLVDVSKSYRTAIIETVMAVSGIKITNDDIDRIKKKPNSNNDWDVSYALAYEVEDLAKIDRSGSNYKKLKAIFQNLYLGRLRNLETPIAKLTTLNSLLSSGYYLGIVTSRPREEALYVLEQFFPKIFDPKCVVALEDCKVEKPNPDPVLLAARAMGCDPLDCTYVGDTVNDMLAAKAAGSRFVSVTKGLGAIDEFIDDVNEIVRRVS